MIHQYANSAQDVRPQLVPNSRTSVYVETVPFPRRLLFTAALTPSALRLYATLYERGAAVAPVSIPLTALASELGYSQRQVLRAMHRLCPQFVVVSRRGPRSAPSFLLRTSRDGAA